LGSGGIRRVRVTNPVVESKPEPALLQGYTTAVARLQVRLAIGAALLLIQPVQFGMSSKASQANGLRGAWAGQEGCQGRLVKKKKVGKGTNRHKVAGWVC